MGSFRKWHVQLVKKFHGFCGTRRCIAVFTTVFSPLDAIRFRGIQFPPLRRLRGDTSPLSSAPLGSAQLGSASSLFQVLQVHSVRRLAKEATQLPLLQLAPNRSSVGSDFVVNGTSTENFTILRNKLWGTMKFFGYLRMPYSEMFQVSNTRLLSLQNPK
jgi:hypothetical protein